jgi:hypothetical protein
VKRRPRRALPALALALALVAVCVTVAWSLVQRLTGTREFVFYARVAVCLHETTWADRWVVVAGVGAVLSGLALLALALLPGRAVVLPLAGDDQFAAGVARRGLCGALQDAARSVEGVRSARVRLRHRKVRVIVRTGRAHPAGLSESVHAAVDERIRRIGPSPAWNVSVRPRRIGAR